MKAVEIAAAVLCCGIVGTCIMAMCLCDMVAGTSLLELERRNKR